MSAESRPSYPRFPVSDDSNRLYTRRERRVLRREHRREQARPHKLLRGVGAFALTTALLYGLDVAHGEQSLKDAKSSVTSVMAARSPLDSNKAVVDSAGWGNLSAYNTAAALPSFAGGENIWALRYDNTGIDTDSIARQLVEKAQKEGVDELSFSGHSMGGLVDLEIARKIYEGNNNITIPYIVLDCTPASMDAVRPNLRSEGYMMVDALNYIPGARESSAVRFIAEEGARFDQYEDVGSPYIIDPVNFVQVTKKVVNDKFLSEDAASTSLLDSQFQFIEASGAKNNVLALGKDRGKPKPILVFLRPKDAAADTTVNDDFSQRQFEDYAKAAGLQLIVVNIPGIGHADPAERPAQYNAALIDTVLPKITHEELLAEQQQLKKQKEQEASSQATSILSEQLGSH